MKYITDRAYAKRDKKDGKKQMVGLRVSPQTIKGVEELKVLFARRYPKDRTPTLAGVMNSFIEGRLEYFEARPEELEAELEIFRTKYSTAQPTTLTESEQV